MLFREANEADAAAIAQLITEFTHLPTTALEVSNRLARSRGIEHPILAEVEGKVVGFASLRLVNYLGEDVPCAEISELFVSEQYRRRGLARLLMVELEKVARAAGASSITVLTAGDNDTAIALYQAMGFRQFSIALQKWLTEDRPYRENPA